MLDEYQRDKRDLYRSLAVLAPILFIAALAASTWILTPEPIVSK